MNTQTERPLLIGQLAKLTGRSEHTIRWYETQRLIPGVRRDAQRRRTYGQGHVAWLELLERLRCTGMSIREMREYTSMVKRGAASVRDCRELMQAQRMRVQAKIDDLQSSLELIDAKIAFYGEWMATGKQPPQQFEKSRATRR